MGERKGARRKGHSVLRVVSQSGHARSWAKASPVTAPHRLQFRAVPPQRAAVFHALRQVQKIADCAQRGADDSVDERCCMKS